MPIQKSLDALLSGAVAAGTVTAVTAAIVDRNGLIYADGFGQRAAGKPDPMTPETVVWYASITKPIATAAVMHLVERGQLHLDAPAKQVLPRLGDVFVLTGFDAADTPITRKPASDITLRQLLTHTAGFGHDIWDTEVGRYTEAVGTPSMISGDDEALFTPLLFDPGTSWRYSSGIDWAGKMLEAVSGMSLGAYLQAHMFGPLGITDTAFLISPAMRARLAQIQQRNPADGSLAPSDLPIARGVEFELGGGGLYGTVLDFARFIQMILNEGELEGARILRPETVSQMATSQTGDIRVRPMPTCKPLLSNDADFFPGMAKTWGLGFMINQAQAWTGRAAGSLAWAGLANTYFWIDPVNGVGGVFATQILPFADVKALPLYLDMEHIVYESLA